MPSSQEIASRLREETRRALAQHLHAFEEEFRNLQSNLSTSVSQAERRLGSIFSLDVPSAEEILSVAISETARERTRNRDEEMLSLAHFAHDMRSKETQEDILNWLLDGALRYAPRLLLFVTRSNRFVGWSSRGFDADAVQELSNCTLSHADSLLLQMALEADGLTTANDTSKEAALSALLKCCPQGPWHAFPLKAIRRPVAVLLATPAGGQGCDLESLCILMDFTGLCIENLALKVLQESKGTGAPVEAHASAASEAREEHELQEPVRAAGIETAEPAAIPVESPVQAAAYAAPVEPATERAEPHAVFHAPEMMEAEPERESEPIEVPATIEPVPESHSAATPVEEPVASTAEAEAQREAQVKAEAAKAAVLREVQPLSEEEKLHADAKRFARLLASEIKLYNEQRVQEGRLNRDLYVRLKRDIDRSRDMYEKRVSPIVSRKVDYLHDEIIRILGDNDPSTLGSDYPGPRVDS